MKVKKLRKILLFFAFLKTRESFSSWIKEKKRKKKKEQSHGT